MSMLEHLKRVDFEIGCYTSDGELIKGTEEQICILFNNLTISVEEVNKLIKSGEYEYDSRFVVTTTQQADNLTRKGKDTYTVSNIQSNDVVNDSNNTDEVNIKHAYWVLNKHQAADEKSYFCSLCAEGGSDLGLDNYCNYCGAKMDLKKKTNKEK